MIVVFGGYIKIKAISLLHPYYISGTTSGSLLSYGHFLSTQWHSFHYCSHLVRWRSLSQLTNMEVIVYLTAKLK
jgi:hypothetical protein